MNGPFTVASKEKTSRRNFLKLAPVGAALATFGAGPLLAAQSQPTLGLILPPANLPVPPEAYEMYPAGVQFLALGVGLERMTPEGYDHVVDRIVPAAKKLASNGANAIDVMGTSLTFYKGAEFNQHLKESVTKATGLPATTMSTAIVDGTESRRRAPARRRDRLQRRGQPPPAHFSR